MKTLFILLISLFCISFCPTTEKEVKNSNVEFSSGFYIVVEDFTDRTDHKFIVESKDSVNIIFKQYFESELELGNVNNPISIFNRKYSFYIARVNVFEKPNGKKSFRNLKYASVYRKRSAVKTVTF